MYRSWRDDYEDSKTTEMNLIPILKSLLKDISLGAKSELTTLDEADAVQLLLCYEDTVDEKPRETIVGYPTYPLYRELGNLFENWATTGRCPVLELPTYNLLDELGYDEKRAEINTQVTSHIEKMKHLWQDFSEDERKYKLQEVINLLGKRGLLDMLGVRKTAGTVEAWPPPRKVLENTFCTKHKPSTAALLTVGARALTKHCHRDQTSSWWGNVTGTETQKNEHALAVMNRILDNAMWINIHTLPHEVFVVEVRHKDGYGVRWTSDGKQFRGFLEPQMVGGHDVGWKH